VAGEVCTSKKMSQLVLNVAAAVFGYFELLLQSGDLRRIADEKARLRGFNETMGAAGIDVDILIDMFDSTYELFDRIQTAIEGENKTESVLLEAMNDEGDSSCILYHFKVSGIRTSYNRSKRVLGI
jgi:Peptidase C65 Otubain